MLGRLAGREGLQAGPAWLVGWPDAAGLVGRWAGGLGGSVVWQAGLPV